jgi:hypothetical protein
VLLPENSICSTKRKSSFRGNVGLKFIMYVCNNFALLKASYGGLLNKIQVKTRICHDGEVHRARSMPQNNVFLFCFVVFTNINNFL